MVADTLYATINQVPVGELQRGAGGVLLFTYAPTWLDVPRATPISLSIPLARATASGPEVQHYFAGLLPDRDDVRVLLRRTLGARSERPFDLLVAMGRDCVGAIELSERRHDDATALEHVGSLGLRLTRAQVAERIQQLTDFPLGMTESSLPIEDPSLPEPSASGHLNEGCVAELTGDGATGVDTDTDPTDWTVSYGQGGGGMTSTLSDLGLWADSNSGNTFLSPDLQEARLVAETPIGGPEIYALGIFQLGDNWYGHAGEAIGWQTLVLHDPDTGVSVAFASNMCSGQDLIYWSILNELYPNATLDEFLTSNGL